MNYKEPIESKKIFYNSLYRQSGEIYDHSFILSPDILTFKDDCYAELELLSFVCKQSYYNISTSRNNKFYYNQGNGNVLVQLTPGNYNVKELATEIENQLNASGSLVWNITYSLITLKYTFNYTGVPLQTPVVSQYLTLDGLSILGFQTTTTLTNGITSTKQLSIGDLAALFLQCDLVNNSRNVANQTSRPILAMIPVVCQLYGTIYYSATLNNTPKIIIKSSNNNNVLSLQLKDVNNNLVLVTQDFNIEWRLNIYKKDNFSLSKLMSLLTLLVTKPNNQQKIKE